MKFLDSAVGEIPADLSADLVAEVSPKLSDIENLPNRLTRYGKAKRETVTIYGAVEKRVSLLSVGSEYRRHLEKISKGLRECGDYLRFKHYFTVGTVKMSAANFCHKHLLCQLCAIFRSAKLIKAYVSRYHAIMSEPENQDLRLSLVTFTVKNGDDFEERYYHIKKSFSTLTKNRRESLRGAKGYSSEFSKAVGIVGAYETTNKGKGYHVHIHCMVLHREKFDYNALKTEWHKITGDSHVVNVSAAKHPENPALDFIEVFKYFVKFGDLEPDKVIDCYEVLRGQRLIVSAGLFYNTEVPEEETDYSLDDLPYIEMVYRYVCSSGYNLVSSEQKEPLPVESRRVIKPKEPKAAKQLKAKTEKTPVIRLEIPERIQREAQEVERQIAKRKERLAFQKSIDDMFSIDSS